MEGQLSALVAAMGIPSIASGLMVWWFKCGIDRRERAKESREQNIEALMLLIVKETRATNVLAEATAKAVQRIPDAHCNGDMTAALERAAAIQREEKDFLADNGIRHIFGD